MLKIHKPFSKKCKLLTICITSICITSSLLGISILTYTPELSHAETVVYPEKETRTMGGITYMQDITQEICANTKEADTKGNYQYQLIDKRDSKTYWAAKLKDGNCWMTQNLDLDLSTSRTLTSTDSNVLTSWTPSESTQTSLIPNFGTVINSIKSWDPGASSGEKYCNNSGCNLTISTNGGHDAQGNYYSWSAATAGKAVGLANFDVSDQSICPQGWKLPLSGDPWSKYNNVSGSIYNLLDKYGLSSGPSTSSATGYSIFSTPLFFGASGYTNSDSAVSRGREGRYWSSVSFYDDSAYSLQYAYTAHTEPSSIVGRQFGFTIRCVALGGEKDNNVDVVVNPMISLDVAEEVTVEKNEANPSTAELDVKVSSNQPYTVAISANDPVMRSSTASVTIPAKGGLLNTAENGWGIKLKESGEYMAVTNDLQTFYTATGAEVKIIPFTIGISTSPDIPNGEYSTDITVTATQN